MKNVGGHHILQMLAVSVLSAGFAACAQDRPAGEVRVGAILSMSGTAADYGEEGRRGIEIAQEYINDSGGVLGRPFEVTFEDSEGDKTEAINDLLRLASDSTIVAILGPTRTATSIAASDRAAELGIVMMSVGSTGVWPTDFNPWTFRSTRVDTYIVRPLLAYLRDEHGAKRLALITAADDDWARSATELYELYAPELGMEIVSSQAARTGDLSYATQITAIRASAPDILIVNLLSQAAPTFVEQARAAGLETQIAGTAAFSNPSTWQTARPESLEGILLGENYFAGDGREIVRELNARYREKYGTDAPAYAAYAFDGALLVADAIRRADGPGDRNAIREALSSTRGFEGTLGILNYDGSGDALKAPVILRISGGTYTRAN